MSLDVVFQPENAISTDLLLTHTTIGFSTSGLSIHTCVHLYIHTQRLVPTDHKDCTRADLDKGGGAADKI